MSFRRLLDRTVTVVPRVVVGQDDRGNDVIEDGDAILDVRAGRDLDRAEEDLRTRDQQETTRVYFLALTADDGTLVELDGYAQIIDGDETFELRGEPEVIVSRRRHGRPHHIEALAYRIAG